VRQNETRTLGRSKARDKIRRLDRHHKISSPSECHTSDFSSHRSSSAQIKSSHAQPLLIAKGQKRFEGFDEKIIAMDAPGMTVREIQGFLLDQYKVEVSADFISTGADWFRRHFAHPFGSGRLNKLSSAGSGRASPALQAPLKYAAKKYSE
jgi:Transposase, Mutator family